MGFTNNVSTSGLYKFFTYENSGVNYTEAFITVDSTLNDNPPQFNASYSQFYLCYNTPTTLPLNASDLDGDSLVYTLIPARVLDSTGIAGVPVSYLPPLSPTNFLSSSTPIVFDNVAGTVSFTPNQLGPGVMVVQVDEYKNNNWLGSVMREVHFEVINMVTSSSNQETSNHVRIHPNPVKEKFYIESEEVRSYSLTDPAGHIILNGTNEGSIDLVDVKSGLYFLHLFTDDSVIISRIIKE